MINIKRLLFVFSFFTCFFIGKDLYAQEINQFDENKKRTGIWKKYHPNKRIRYVGEFKNGKEVGVFKFYDISNSKTPSVIKIFSKHSDSVAVEFYTLKGKLQSKGFFIDKKRVGKWVYFFADGKTMSEELYTDGKLEGKLVNYYPNGNVTEITTYKNGLKEGLSQKFSSKGILIEETTFQNGIENGVAKYFDLKGNLKETGTYKNGQRFGDWEYYIDGEIATETEKKKDKSTYTKKNEH